MNAYARVFDPHSSYFSPRNSEEYRIQMSLSYEGIGASLQLVDDYVTVLSILAGRPGCRSRSARRERPHHWRRPGQATASCPDVIGWRLDDVVQLIRGKSDRRVRSTAGPARPAPPRRAGEGARAHAQQGHARSAGRAQGSAQGEAWRPRDLPIGVINVPSFYQDFEAARAPATRTTAAPRATCASLIAGAQERPSIDGAGHRPAQQRRRPPAGGHGADRPVHSTAGRSCSCARPADASRCSMIRSQHPPTTARWPCWSTASALRLPRSSPAAIQDYGRGLIRRPADLRQGHGAEPDVRSTASRSDRSQASAS